MSRRPTPKWIRGWECWRCVDCGEYKRRSDYHKRRARFNGLLVYCKDCATRRNRAAWQKDIEHSRELSRVSSSRSYNKRKPKQKSRPYKWSVERAARDAVREAVYKGRTTKPDNCERCGSKTPKHLLHGHHHDYTKKLDVEWLCPRCHGKDHRATCPVSQTNPNHPGL